MDDERRNHSDSKRLPRRNRFQQACSDNVSIDIVENLSGQIWDEIYCSLKSRRQLTEEQKRSNKGTRRKGNLLYIDQHIFKENKTRRKNVAMGWINYKMAYDIVPKSGIKDSQKCIRNPTKLILEAMKNRKVELIAWVKTLLELKILRGIFRGNVLSRLLIVIAMMPLNNVLRMNRGAINSSNRKNRLTT